MCGIPILEVDEMGPPTRETGSHGWFGCRLLGHLENKKLYLLGEEKGQSAY